MQAARADLPLLTRGRPWAVRSLNDHRFAAGPPVLWDSARPWRQGLARGAEVDETLDLIERGRLQVPTAEQAGGAVTPRGRKIGRVVSRDRAARPA